MIKEKSRSWNSTSQFIGKLVAVYSPLPVVSYTVASLVLGVTAIFFAYEHYYVLSIFLFLTSGLFDIIDGAAARAKNEASHLGAFLDGTVDRFVDFAIVFSFFFFEIDVVWLSLDQWICITSFVVILPSFIVAYANHRGAVNDDNETLIWRLMNRGEMFFIMMAVLILSLINPVWSGYALIVLVVLASITILQTIVATIYHAQKIVGSK